jgi:alkylation response protein AidB-like acyl-CoA dehydrogenase
MTEDVRAALLAWLQDAWDPELSLAEWRTRLAQSGWAAPTWPGRLGGRSLAASAASIVTPTLAEFGAVGPPEGPGMSLAAPTLLEHGSRELQARFLPPTVAGQITWCQLFSEPGAGSDLAGLTTKAELAGSEWHVSGQKVWNTSAHHADYGLLLARTDPDVPKHHGLTYFVLPMRQPGVEVRPLRQANGHASFNEVFLDQARIPASLVIGTVDGGWRVALTTLAHERRAAIASPPAVHGDGRAWRDLAAGRVVHRGRVVYRPAPHPTAESGQRRLSEVLRQRHVGVEVLEGHPVPSRRVDQGRGQLTDLGAVRDHRYQVFRKPAVHPGAELCLSVSEPALPVQQ